MGRNPKSDPPISGIWTPSNTWLLPPTKVSPQTAPRWVQLLLRTPQQSFPMLQPPKLPPPKGSAPQLIMVPGPIRFRSLNGISISSAVFAYTAVRLPMLLNRTDNPQNLRLPHMVPWAHQSQTPNVISTGSAVSTGFTNVTNTHTDRLTTLLRP